MSQKHSGTCHKHSMFLNVEHIDVSITVSAQSFGRGATQQLFLDVLLLGGYLHFA